MPGRSLRLYLVGVPLKYNLFNEVLDCSLFYCFFLDIKSISGSLLNYYFLDDGDYFFDYDDCFFDFGDFDFVK